MKMTKAAAIALSIWCLAACRGVDERALQAAGSGEAFEKIDAYLSAYEEEKQFSGYVMIASPEGVLYGKGFGAADYENGRPNQADTIYRIGSITKMMTAAALLRCEERGLLSLDDRVDRYIPEYGKGGEMTIHHLLSNTSGIPDISLTLWLFKQRGNPFDFGRLLERINGQDLLYPPGSDWNYSNPNFMLAGEILQRVSGLSAGEFFRREIFAPLGMDRSGFGENRGVPGEALGYSRLRPRPRAPKKTLRAFSFTAGNVYSTPEDMAKWLGALYEGEFLSEDQRARMFAPYGKMGENSYYGLGCFLSSRTIGGKEWNFISHSGGVTGFSCIVTVNQETGLQVIILGNYRNLLKVYKEEIIEGEIVKMLFEGL